MNPLPTTFCEPFPPLVQRINAEAVVINDRILKIDHLLNHRIDADLMQAIGAELATRLAPFQPDLILTAEASGIPPALSTAFACRKPLVYAKKYHPDVPMPALTRRVSSPTKGGEVLLAITARFIPAKARLAIVDDFLANGRTALALAEMAQEAGASVVAAAFVVEKVFQQGREPLLALGVPVIALAQIERFADGQPVIVGWPLS
jgi:xanthine phosphoribosyltransferase